MTGLRAEAIALDCRTSRANAEPHDSAPSGSRANRPGRDSATIPTPEKLVNRSRLTSLPRQLVLMFLFASIYESRHNGNIFRHLGCGPDGGIRLKHARLYLPPGEPALGRPAPRSRAVTNCRARGRDHSFSHRRRRPRPD